MLEEYFMYSENVFLQNTNNSKQAPPNRSTCHKSTKFAITSLNVKHPLSLVSNVLLTPLAWARACYSHPPDHLPLE